VSFNIWRESGFIVKLKSKSQEQTFQGSDIQLKFLSSIVYKHMVEKGATLAEVSMKQMILVVSPLSAFIDGGMPLVILD